MLTHRTAKLNVHWCLCFCSCVMMLFSSLLTCGKKAAAQSEGFAKQSRSDCSWRFFHCLPASLDYLFLASFLVYGHTVWMNERNVAERSERNGANEWTLCGFLFGRWFSRTRCTWVSGRSAKQSWSERSWKIRFIRIMLKGPFWNSEIFTDR